MRTIKDRWKSLETLNFPQLLGYFYCTLFWPTDQIFTKHISAGFAGRYYSVITYDIRESFIFCFNVRVSCDFQIFLPVVVITLPVARAGSMQLRHLS